MTRLPDSEFAEAHQLFNRDHAAQRERLMTMLSQAREGEASAEPRRRTWWRMIPLPMRLTVAALLIAATAALVSTIFGQRAYGIEDMRERLLTIRSLHLKGWVYHYTKTDSGKVPLAFPTESFCERPYRQYRTGYGFSDNGRKLTVTSRVFVSDGQQSMLIDKDNKTATFTPANKLESELMVEGSLQQRLLDELGEGDLGDFEKVATERVNDVVCDVYELKSNGQPGGRHADGPDQRIRFRTRLWLDPQSGIPVKAASYSIEPDGTEEIFWEWTEIGINVEPPEGMFSFEVPAGYERIEGEPTSPITAMASMTGGGGMTSNGTSANISSGVALNIDDKAVLYCWSLKTSDKNGVKWFEGQPEFSVEGSKKRPCDEITLRTDASGDEQVRWSLIVPHDRQRLGSASLRMLYRLGRSSSSMEARPLKFNENRLVELVEEVQRRTLLPNHDAAELWTLEELREKLGEIR